MSSDNGLVEMTKQAANKTKNSVLNDQSDISSLSGMLGDLLDEEGKPQLPEIDTTPKIEYLGSYESVADELRNSNYEKISSCIKNAENKHIFNDEIFTVYNYKITSLDEDIWGGATPSWYLADEYKKTRSVAIEFNISSKDFKISGVGGFRISVWDYNKNRWKYIVSKTGINEESDSMYSVTFPDETQRTVRIETLDAFYRIVCKKG